MWESFQNAGARRFWVAAGLSVAFHAAIAVSVPRSPGSGVLPSQAETSPQPLIARLASAVSDAVIPVAASTLPVVPTTLGPVPPMDGATTTPPALDALAEAGSAYYFKTTELDRRPFPLARIDVPPPESAIIDSGSLIIRLRISERGRVDDAKIIMSTGLTEFEAIALREFSRAEFRPGYRSNLPVRSEMLIEVTLRPPTGSDNNSRTEPAPTKD